MKREWSMVNGEWAIVNGQWSMVNVTIILILPFNILL